LAVSVARFSADSIGDKTMNVTLCKTYLGDFEVSTVATVHIDPREANATVQGLSTVVLHEPDGVGRTRLRLLRRRAVSLPYHVTLRCRSLDRIFL
jgi:hypothetical protein